MAQPLRGAGAGPCKVIGAGEAGVRESQTQPNKQVNPRTDDKARELGGGAEWRAQEGKRVAADANWRSFPFVVAYGEIPGERGGDAVGVVENVRI